MMDMSYVKQTAEKVCRMKDVLSGADREYAVQFALRTKDKELTAKLIDELAQPGADREAVMRRFYVMEDQRPGWIRDIENLLVSLELYRVEEEMALNTLAGLLSVCGMESVEKEYGRTGKAGERIGVSR